MRPHCAEKVVIHWWDKISDSYGEIELGEAEDRQTGGRW